MGTNQATVEVGTGRVVVADIDQVTVVVADIDQVTVVGVDTDQAAVVVVDTDRAVKQHFKLFVEEGTILVIIEEGTGQVATEEGMLLATAATLVKLDTVEVAAGTDFARVNPMGADCTAK